MGLEFRSVSVFVLISTGFMKAGLVIAGSCGVVTIPDVVGLLVVLCNSVSVLLSMSGMGRGRGCAVTVWEVFITAVLGMERVVDRTVALVAAGVAKVCVALSGEGVE